MKNIHVLPTNKPSRLHFDDKLFLSTTHQLSSSINSIVEGKNIYITSSEGIKEGDCVFDVFKNACPTIRQLKTDEEVLGVQETEFKIILTTDQDLIKDGVQAIDDEFLEWFIKNSSCEEVEIVKDMELDYPLYLEYSMIYKIIIPKEEPKREFVNNTSKWNIEDFEEPKQETLEEFVESYVNRIDRSEDGLVEQCLRDGAKWQQEQIIDFLHSEITERRDYSASKMCEKVIEFIKQFKNK